MPRRKTATFRATATPVNSLSRGESRRPLRRGLAFLSLWLALVLAAGWLSGLPVNYLAIPQIYQNHKSPKALQLCLVVR